MAKHAAILGQSTANSSCVVGEVPLDQVTPSIVRIVLPASPTATQACILAQLIRVRRLVTGEGVGVHVTQPFVVERIAPVPSACRPTAKHTVVVGHAIPAGKTVLPRDCGVQLAPPSWVLRMEPLPTAKQVQTLGQLMSSRLPVPASYRFDHDLPPSLVPRMTEPDGPPREKKPTLPTLKHVFWLGHLTRLNGTVDTAELKEFHEFPPSLVVAIAP
jgi:hypothetical protein